ncbi:MFS transporter [Streptomyces sp. NPDC012461]|uniref:MFS transporter n=2 Tax=unclassified Streptomyces TaxID=2593676 RepID=A0A6G3R110_9ACTN|nr:MULTISPECIES: MFS transporter [unclassified Streptomyces]NEA89438.1 MFS transporter [Streptomyces sp. SID14436]NEC81660.1 MFS transporter [Streptomyces sp. SID7958]
MTDSAEQSSGSLKELLRHGGYWRWSAAAQAYRLPRIMAPIAFVLVAMQQRDSVALGGVLVTVWTLVPAAVAPLAGRVYDRIGVATWAPRLLVVMAAGLGLIAMAFHTGAPAPLIVLIAGVIAAVGAGLGGSTRTLLGQRVPKRLLPPALSLDSSVIELVVIAAPFVVILTALVAPVAPLYAMAIITLLAAVLLRPRRAASTDIASADGADDAPQTVAPGLWRNPRFWFWLAVSGAFGQSLGTLEIGALPLSDSFGTGNSAAATLIAILAIASVLSGFGYGAVATRMKLGQVWRSIILMSVMIAAGMALAFAQTFWQAVIGYVVIGLCTAPLNTVLFYSVELVVDPARKTEAFSSVTTANAIGFAVPGALLALLPLPVIFGLSGAFAVCALIVALVYGHHRDNTAASAVSPTEQAAT